MTQEVASIQSTQLDNGLTIISEKMPYVRSVSLGIWIRSGSRLESAEQNGISHFIEHMLFKGTERRSARDIAAETDAIGGHMDAFTSRECACYHVKVLDEHLPMAMDVLADLTTSPLFDPNDIEKERGVILEEIKMVEDTPDDLIFEEFLAAFWPNHPLGRSILGTEQTINSFDCEQIWDYYRRVYVPANMLITAAGNLEHSRLVEMAAEYFGHLPSANGLVPGEKPTTAAPILLRHKPELEQAHLVIGFPCPSLISEERFACNILNVILGGGMSSRLFQTIREEHALAYAVSSGINASVDAGCFSVYAATSPEQLREVIALTMAELKNIKNNPVSSAELKRAKDQLKASIMLNLESTGSRMHHLAQQEIFFRKRFTLDEIKEKIDAVTAEDVERLANDILKSERAALIVLGNIGDFDIDRSQLQC